MSRYVHVVTELRALAEIEAGLRALGLAFERADVPRGLSLAGSLECAGEPVDLRLAAGAAGSVEDFGWRRGEDGALTLVCGEPDRDHLEVALLQPLRRELALQRARAAAEASGCEIEEVVDTDGAVRLKLRR
ncbi:MAG: hypothetical protein R3A79_14315 [Nannocystaceae bacterium]